MLIPATTRRSHLQLSDGDDCGGDDEGEVDKEEGEEEKAHAGETGKVLCKTSSHIPSRYSSPYVLTFPQFLP